MPSLVRRLATGLVALTALVTPARGQVPASGDAASIYRQVAASVFLIEVRDSAGKALGLGSAFLVGDRRLVTNAHVVRGGMPFLKAGAVALPLTVERIDVSLDLASLRSSTPLEAAILEVSSVEPAPGTPVFALGNPAGLEKSISEGIVSGIRERDGRRLLQITAPISPGSSGGPVMGKDGRVYGVTVGFLENGQNLNFAIPGSVVVGFLTAPAGATSFQTALAAAQEASAIPFPDYTDLAAGNSWRTRVGTAVNEAASLARTGDEFLAVAAIASKGAGRARVRSLSDEAIRRHTRLPDSARTLMMNAWELDLIFSADSMSRQELGQALSVADTLVAHTARNADAHMFRARILSALGRGPEAIASANRAVSLVTDTATVRFYWTTLHEIVASRASGAEDDAVFARMVQAKHMATYDWAEHGEHLMKRERWSDAANAYAEAYRASPTDAAYACEAGRGYWTSSQADLALDAFRACLESFARSATPDSTKMAYAHRGIATILNDRGVSAQAETHARQARVLESGNAWTALELSRALLDQDRASEAATAAEEAVRLSDGKFSLMQFAAGQAYFKLQDWSKCARAFQHAAELDTKDDISAFNTALCLARQGFTRDAATWMETAIRRNPTSPDRANRDAFLRSWKAPLN